MAPSDPPHGYAICGGKEGKERLDLLARVLLPTTMQLLNRAGLIRGMKCLDVGCGGGHVAISMARVLGPEGCVIGTDTDAEILAFARDDAEAAKVTTVKFRQVDGCACVWHEQFDVAYARFLFSHLNRRRSVSQPGASVRPRRNYRHRGHGFCGEFLLSKVCGLSAVQRAVSSTGTTEGWRSKYRIQTASHVAPSWHSGRRA
jgi:SAM-dependent methyltransferase